MKKNFLTVTSFALTFAFYTICLGMEGTQRNAPGERLEQKTATTQTVANVGNGWYPARLITVGTQVYLKHEATYELRKETSDPVTLHLYKRIPNQDDPLTPSHGLLKSPDKSVGVSVDTSIHTTTTRKKEGKSTFIQYDKSDIKQEGTDFQVDTNRVSSKNKTVLKTNYDGGHLADHKFSAQGSHTDKCNYIPQHHYYNSWLKENLVKNTDGYLEIPLYTPNPPLIKVLGEQRYDPIPIGILLVPLLNQNIQGMYYFPNNQFNYRTLQIDLDIKKGMAVEMCKFFKLKPAFEKLLWPAVLHDLNGRPDNIARQFAQEAKGKDVVDVLVDGMLHVSLQDDEEVISTLASEVIHEGKVSISNILTLNTQQFAALNRGQANATALGQSFNELGYFLVEYAMKNALKSEMLSTHSRIMFADLITDFIECSSQVSPEALVRVDRAFSDVYEETLDELWKIRKTMNLRDSLYFANLYSKLSSPFIHPAFFDGFEVIGGMDFESHAPKLVKILKNIHDRPQQEFPNKSEMQNLVSLFLDAQEHLAYLITLGEPKETLEKELTFMKRAKKRVLEWHTLSAENQGTFQTSPNSHLSFRVAPSTQEFYIEFLGTTSSPVYPNASDDDDELTE